MTRFLLALPLLAACAPVPKECVIDRFSLDPKTQVIITEPCPARAVPPAMDNKDGYSFPAVGSIPDPTPEPAPVTPAPAPEPPKPEPTKPDPEPERPEPQPEKPEPKPEPKEPPKSDKPKEWKK